MDYRNLEQEETVRRVKELILPILSGRQVELVELKLSPAGGGRSLLRLLVDTAQGIRLDQLSHLNQAIGAVLDEHNVIPDRYTLEVSSPGLDRPLKTGVDFERVIGRRIKVQTSVPVNARREFAGKVLLGGVEGVVLELDSGERLRFPLDQIIHAVQDMSI